MRTTSAEVSGKVDGLVRIVGAQLDLNCSEDSHGGTPGEYGASIQGTGRASRELRVAV
jgi:hypothetical protein